MPTTSSPRRTPRASTTPKRFPRAGTPARTTARPATRPTGRPSMPLRRKPKPQSTSQQIFGALSKALPSAAAAKKAKPSGSKGKGGLALLGLAGAAAVMKKRGKGPFGGKGEEVVVEPTTPAPATYPTNDVPTSDLSGGVRPAI